MARLQYILHLGLIPFFLVWRIFDFFLAYLAPSFLPFYGNFSHPSTLNAYNFPHWLKGFAQFDGIFYLRIAQSGYAQFEHAFFPLYPLCIRAFSFLFMQNWMLTSLAISHTSFLVGLLVFEKYLCDSFPKNQYGAVRSTIIFLLLFPSSFFFWSSYTESLFFLLVISTFFLLKKKNYALAALFAYLASLTRFIGVFLFIPFVLEQNKLYRKIFTTMAPFLGLGTYALFLYQTTSDPLAFFNSQSAFGAGRTTHFISLPQVLFRYLKILTTTQWNFGYFVALLELSVFLLVLTILLFQLRDLLRSKNRDLLGLNLFSLANLLIPTVTGTLLSIPRFSLLSLSFFMYLGALPNKNTKLLLYFIFTLLHVALVTLFIQGYFVS